VTAAIQLVCSVFLVGAAIIARSTFPTDPRALATAALLGLIGAGAYASYFNGLRIGPISVVSGMVAAYGGLTVVLSVVLRGESLTGLQALGATVATIGVILTGVAFDGLRGTRFAGPGVVFAVIALVLFATMAITMDIALESADWVQVLLVSRLVIVAVSIAAIIVLAVAADRGRGRSGIVAVPIPFRRVGAMLFVAGALDAAGLVAFAIGLSSAPTWMVGLASSFGPAVTILVAVAFLGERLKRIQWFGLIGVAIGMVAIGLP
jgi:drug/metabolite transporter (DMT)-like permease